MNATWAAFWSGLRNMMIDEVGLGSGWLERATRHARQSPKDRAQRGNLFLPKAIMLRGKGAYRRGEILRLRGAFDAADRRAGEIAVDPQPGLALCV